MSRFFPRIGAIVITAGFITAALAAQTASKTASQIAPLSTPMELTHDKPFVTVMVNGKGPFRFVIDTGTGAEAFVTGELADQLGLPVTGYVHLSDASKQGGQRVPLVTIQSLEVAGVVFRDVKAARHALSDADGNCDGLLGFELFRDYLLTLDYPNRRMTLSSGSLEPDGERSVLPFRMPDGIPIIPLRIGSVQIDAQIDSGGTGLSLPEKIASRLDFDNAPSLFGIGQSLSSRFELKAARLTSDLRLGNYTFLRPFVEINPAFPLANFGSSAMQNFTFTFDQKDALVRFESSQQIQHLSPTPTPVRMELAPTYKPVDTSLVPVG
jgi:predicted aspartyl protease